MFCRSSSRCSKPQLMRCNQTDVSCLLCLVGSCAVFCRCVMSLVIHCRYRNRHQLLVFAQSFLNTVMDSSLRMYGRLHDVEEIQKWNIKFWNARKEKLKINLFPNLSSPFKICAYFGLPCRSVTERFWQGSIMCVLCSDQVHSHGWKIRGSF